MGNSNKEDMSASEGDSLAVNCGDEKKKQVFRPKIKPRYLIGSETTTVIVRDLIEYNKHRYKVFTATCRVDSNPPAFHPNIYLKKPQLAEAVQACNFIEKQNKILLHKINAINRGRGYVDSFNKAANNQCSKWGITKAKLKLIDQENMKLYHKIVNAKAAYSRAEHEKFFKVMLESMYCFAKFPFEFKKKTNDSLLKQCPSITMPDQMKSASFIESIKRPKIFLEFKLDGHVNIIGRVIFELYKDVCPQTVENFISLCSGCKESTLTYKNSLLHKIVYNKYCVMGDITLRNGKGGASIYGDSFDAENFELQHTRQGVLSMVCFKDNKVNSQFCMTFTSMPELNGKQVVFGKCIKGSEYLRKVSDYGQPTGKPLGAIIICNCGVVKKKRKKKIVDNRPKKDYIKMNIKAVKGKRDDGNANYSLAETNVALL